MDQSFSKMESVALNQDDLMHINSSSGGSPRDFEDASDIKITYGAIPDINCLDLTGSPKNVWDRFKRAKQPNYEKCIKVYQDDIKEREE